MLEKIKKILIEYKNIKKKLLSYDIINDYKKYQEFLKKIKILEPIVFNFKKIEKIEKEIIELKKLLSVENDNNMLNMIQEELENLNKKNEKLEKQIKILLLPKDINDEKSVIIEIRAGAGGDEAALFANDLFKMYIHFAENNNWKFDILSSNENYIGGYKEIIFSINSKGVYSKLKYESGVHRVQRIPETESGGRVHTSTVTVAVLIEAQDIDVEINQNDIRIDLFCSSGPGGQSVNTTKSAVRLTHIPSGITVSCQDEKSQHKNKEKAMKVLRARLYDKALKEEALKVSSERKNQIGTGDRSERIRTYNYPQNRVTDHRIGLTIHNLDKILEGNLSEMIEKLIILNESKNLKNNHE